MPFDDQKEECSVLPRRSRCASRLWRTPGFVSEWDEPGRVCSKGIGASQWNRNCQILWREEVFLLLVELGSWQKVPADFVVNAILAATAKHGAVGKSESSTVYQVASSVINPLLVNETLAQLGYEYFNSMLCTDSMGRPIQVLEPKIYSSMEDFKSHLWTEAIQYSKLTALANQNGKVSPKPINIGRITTECLKYLAYLANIYQAYTCYGGRFDSSNTQRLMQCTCEEERSKFGFDLASIDWKDYVFNTHIPGVRKHVMTEKRDV